jgi:nitrate/nitrite-specific signal transduction histidine kinase
MTVITVNEREIIRNVVPLYNEPRCQTCHGTGASVLGDSIVDLRLDSYRRTVATITIVFGIGIATAILFVALILYLLLRRLVIAPVDELVTVTHSVVRGDLGQRVSIHTTDELGQLGTAFNSMTEQIRNILGELEQRVADRTKTLEQRTAYLEASAEVSRAAATILVPELLIQEAVNLIKEQFDLYYVGLFLVDDLNEWCMLQAGTGDEGRSMLEKGHRIKIGEGMIGWCVVNSQARIALDSGLDAVRFDNPDTPKTRSEGALPLRSREKVLGAITVQSDKPSAFDENSITVLQTMADQIALALDNAELLAQAEKALEAERRAFGELSRKEWLKLLEGAEMGVIASGTSNIQTPTDGWTPKMQETAFSGQITQQSDDTIHIPIILRGQTLGVVRLRKQQSDSKWSDDEISLMGTLVDQLETALEAARLYSDTQIQAERERLTHEVTDKLHRSHDMDTLMQTFLQEISTALGASSAFVQISTETDAPELESGKRTSVKQ